jgi:hypothetical protein
VAYSAGSIVLKPVQKAAGWAGRRAIAPVQDLAKRAGGAMAAPVVANIDALRATTSEKLTSLASNTAERINKLASDTVPCAKAYGKLAQTLNETIETGAYLATAVTGLYIYNMANNGLGGKNLCGQIQRGVGLTIAAVAGAYWLGRVAVNAIGPKLLKLSQFDFGASIMLPKK